MASSPAILTPDQFRAQFPELVAKASNDAKRLERHAAWIRTKGGKFGASSAGLFWTPKTMKEADNETLRKYIAAKAAELDGSVKPEQGGAASRWGQEQEEDGMREFAELTGLKLLHLETGQKWYAWSKCDQVGATPDDTTLNHNGRLVPVEQKNPYDPAEHARYLTMRNGAELRDVKFDYWAQVQHQIMVLDAPLGIFFSRDPRRQSEARMAWWIVPRDEKFIGKHADRLLRAVTERDELRAQQKFSRPNLKRALGLA